MLLTRRNGQETLDAAAKTFSRGGSFRYHLEKDHVKSRRFRLGE